MAVNRMPVNGTVPERVYVNGLEAFKITVNGVVIYPDFDIVSRCYVDDWNLSPGLAVSRLSGGDAIYATANAGFVLAVADTNGALSLPHAWVPGYPATPIQGSAPSPTSSMYFIAGGRLIRSEYNDSPATYGVTPYARYAAVQAGISGNNANARIMTIDSLTTKIVNYLAESFIANTSYASQNSYSSFNTPTNVTLGCLSVSNLQPTWDRCQFYLYDTANVAQQVSLTHPGYYTELPIIGDADCLFRVPRADFPWFVCASYNPNDGGYRFWEATGVPRNRKLTLRYNADSHYLEAYWILNNPCGGLFIVLDFAFIYIAHSNAQMEPNGVASFNFPFTISTCYACAYNSYSQYFTIACSTSASPTGFALLIGKWTPYSPYSFGGWSVIPLSTRPYSLACGNNSSRFTYCTLANNEILTIGPI